MIETLQGDAIAVIETLSKRFYNTCVTSPPYWGCRSYGDYPSIWDSITYTPMTGANPITIPSWEGCLGQEPTPELYVGHMVLIFRAVSQVLRNDGSLWLNLGDTYISKWSCPRTNKIGNGNLGKSERVNRAGNGLKEKDLTGIPWRVALALQADGWFLRMDNIWSKPNPMPDGAQDRSQRSHEYVFQLSQKHRYLFDREAYKVLSKRGSFKNRPSVWTVPVRSGGGTQGHNASFPMELIEPCIVSSSPIYGKVLDPFGGLGVTGVACKLLRRSCTQIDINPEYVKRSHNAVDSAPPPQLKLWEEV